MSRQAHDDCSDNAGRLFSNFHSTERKTKIASLSLLLAVWLLSSGAVGARPATEQLAATGSAAAVAPIDPPSRTLGFEVGADRKLARWEKYVEYYRYLHRASRRVRVVELGRSTLDRPMLLAIISSPENLRRLEHYREVQESLADLRGRRRPIEDLINEGKTIVLVTCAIHATEVASPLLSMELAHEFATSQDAETLRILDNVIFLLVPSLNPDGLDIVADWYAETLGTPAEGTNPPKLYHHYTGHDNNRDWFMFTQKETRLVVEKVHNVWHPHVVMDLHQMGQDGPRLFVPPFIDPIDPNVDPIIRAKIVELGSFIFSSLTSSGKPGVITQALFDAYTPARAYQHYHGGVRILVEAASARLATPTVQAAAKGNGYDPDQPTWNYPLPWKGGSWKLRDIINYQKHAVKACLIHAAYFRRDWVKGFADISARAISGAPPHAFIIPADQKNREGVRELVDILRFAAVEVHKTRNDFSYSNPVLVSEPFGSATRRTFPAGSYVVLMKQPFRAFAKTMLERSKYPEIRDAGTGGLKQPYDVTAHSLGIMLGVEVHQLDSPFEAQLDPVDRIAVQPNVTGNGNHWLFTHDDNGFARLVNRLLAAGHPVSWAPNGFQSERGGFPVGTVMARVTGEESELSKLLDGLSVPVTRVENAPQLAWQELRRPRIGLYQSHSPSADEGWLRWVLENYEFTYDVIKNKDVLKSDLSRFDLILMPSQDEKTIIEGLSLPYPETYRGGLGSEGVSRLREFVLSGRMLVLLGQSTGLAEKLRLDVSNQVAEAGRSEFYIPGSLLRIAVNNMHPIGYGIPEQAAVMFDDQPVLAVRKGLPIARFSKENALLGGWLTGEKYLSSGVALSEVKLGRGYVILSGFKPHFRGQMRSTYKFLFNAIFHATTLRR